MSEPDNRTFEEKYAELEQDPGAGVLFLNMPIRAIGQVVDVPPDATTDRWESIVAGDAKD